MCNENKLKNDAHKLINTNAINANINEFFDKQINQHN